MGNSVSKEERCAAKCSYLVELVDLFRTHKGSSAVVISNVPNMNHQMPHHGLLVWGIGLSLLRSTSWFRIGENLAVYWLRVGDGGAP